MASSSSAVVVDANVLIAIAAEEVNRHTLAEAILEKYTSDGFAWYAPGAIVSEGLYALCNKLNNGVLSLAEHATAVETFQRLVESVLPPPEGDRGLVRRAERIRAGYGCSRSADGVYIALAEELTENHANCITDFRSGHVHASRGKCPDRASTIDIK